MCLNKYKNLAQAAKALFKRGFKNKMKLQKEGLVDIKTGKIYQQQDINIQEYHRFNHQQKEDAKFIIFAIECKDKTKGIITSSYKEYANMKLVNFLSKVKIKQRIASAS